MELKNKFEINLKVLKSLHVEWLRANNQAFNNLVHNNWSNLE